MALFTLHAFQVSHDGTELLGIYDFIINSELAEESYKIFIRSSQESNKEADTTVRTWWNNLPDTIKRSTNGVRRIPTEKSAIVDPGNLISGEGFFTKILPTYDFFGQ